MKLSGSFSCWTRTRTALIKHPLGDRTEEQNTLECGAQGGARYCIHTFYSTKKKKKHTFAISALFELRVKRTAVFHTAPIACRPLLPCGYTFIYQYNCTSKVIFVSKQASSTLFSEVLAPPSRAILECFRMNVCSKTLCVGSGSPVKS